MFCSFADKDLASEDVRDPQLGAALKSLHVYMVNNAPPMRATTLDPSVGDGATMLPSTNGSGAGAGAGAATATATTVADADAVANLSALLPSISLLCRPVARTYSAFNTALTYLFNGYAQDDQSDAGIVRAVRTNPTNDMTLPQLYKFAADCKIVPNLCSKAELTRLAEDVIAVEK